MRHSQNLPLPPEYTSILHHYMRHSHNLPLPPTIYPPLTVTWNTPGIQPSLPKYTPLLNIYTQAAQNLRLPLRI